MKLPAMNYTDADFLRFDPFEGDRDVDVRLQTVKMVTTRAPQKCLDPNKGKLHPIPAGTRARYEKALVEGQWGSYYICVACMTKWLRDIGQQPHTKGKE